MVGGSYASRRKKGSVEEGSRIYTAIIYLIVAFMAFIAIYPMYYILVLSLSEPLEAITMKVYWFPKGFYFGTYTTLVSDSRLWNAYKNTFYYLIANMALMLVTSVLGAYTLTYKKLIGRKFVNMFLLIPMYISGGLIPSFILMAKLGLYKNPWVMILPSCFSIWYIILVKSYFNTIPESLREAAFIDGANNYQILWNVFIPAATPILAVIMVFTGVDVWNRWFTAAVYLPDEKWQPLQLYLRRMLITMETDIYKDMGPDVALEALERQLSALQMRYAMIIFTTLPIVFIYPFFQRYFIKGIMLGSLKE